MDRHISRRDFVYGASALSATAIASAVMSPVSALAEQVGAASGNYPPSLTGMRGNHPGSFEVAHQRASEGRRDWGPVKNLDDKVYDLVVVGAGISGLSAAYFYLKDHPKADILILDNHDDFGGHAKRNEFQVGDRTLIGYGGSQTLSEPSSFDKVVKDLLSDLGVELGRFDKAYDQDYFKRYGLRAGVHFNKEKWGVDRVVPYDLGFYKGYIPFLPSALTTQQAVANMPISEEAQRELVRLLETDTDQMPHIPVADKADYLYSISYREFLSRHLDIQNPEVFEVMQDMGMDMCVGLQ